MHVGKSDFAIAHISILQHVSILQVLEYFAGIPGVLAWRAWEERGAEERTSKLPGATFTIFTPLQ